MRKTMPTAGLIGLLILVIAASAPLWSCSCGFRYMPKPKVVVEGFDPQVSFYASVLALDKLGYRIQAVDTEAMTIETEPRSGGSYWWQLSLVVAANGHLAVDTHSDLELQRGEQTLTHKGIVNRSIDLSRHIQSILIKVPEAQILADGAAKLPTIMTTPETQIVMPGA
jgi:hypothetical protein